MCICARCSRVAQCPSRRGCRLAGRCSSTARCRTDGRCKDIIITGSTTLLSLRFTLHTRGKEIQLGTGRFYLHDVEEEVRRGLACEKMPTDAVRQRPA